jgi:hypothetical protein
MKVKNLNIIDLFFIPINIFITSLGLYFFIDGWLVKSEAKRRQFNEATDIAQQSYFQDNQILGSNFMILGILIVISSFIITNIYLRHFRK